MLITLLVVGARRDVLFGLVVIWALAGIAVKQSGYQNIVTVIRIGATIIVVAIVASVLTSRLRREKQPET